MQYFISRAAPSLRRGGYLVTLLYITAVINRACVGYSSLANGLQQQTSDRLKNSQLSESPVTSAPDLQEFVDGSHWNPVPFHQVLGTHLDPKTHRCEPVKLALCKGMYYPNTRMPNMFHHETQEEAGLEAHQFYPLVQINCSEDLRFLLCSIYTPICIEGYPSFLPPCRSICERVKAGCAPIMQHYNFPWPDRMGCDQFPEYNNPDGILCMERNLTEQTGPRQTKRSDDELMTVKPIGTETLFETESIHSTDAGDKWLDRFNSEASQTLFKQAMENKTVRNWILTNPGAKLVCHCECMPTAREAELERDTDSGTTVRECPVPCRTSHFSEDVPDGFTTYWLALWSTLCAVSTLLTILTFMLDSCRFQYPELPIIYLSTCYFMVSLGYLIRLILGHESVSCDTTTIVSSLSTTSDSIKGIEKLGTEIPLLSKTITTVASELTEVSAFDRIKVLRYATSGRASCAIVFLLVYFFGLASFVWWVILAFTWFLAAGLKWGSEAISRYSQVFHFIAWSVPTAITALALLLSVVEGDPASGLCTIGTNRSLARILFIFTPSLAFLALGVMFLLAGFVALFRIRGEIKLQRIGLTKTDRLETLMLRIGVFGALYTIPNVTILVCMGYELRNSYSWKLGQMCRCAYEIKSVGPGRGPNQLPEWIPPKPDYIMFLVKHFMSLIIGVTSGFWIWSHKTLNSWRLICRGRCCPPGGGSSHSGTVRLLTNTTNTGEADVSSKQNLGPWAVVPSAVSMRAVNLHPSNLIDLRDEGALFCRSIQNGRKIPHSMQMPLPPVPTGSDAYYYDRVNQSSTALSVIDQRKIRGYSAQSDGSQTMLSPHTDNTDPRTVDGSVGASKKSNLLMHPSMSSVSGFHSPGKIVTTPNNWSALSSSGISSGLTAIGHGPLGKEIDSTAGCGHISSQTDNPTVFPNQRANWVNTPEYPVHDTMSGEQYPKGKAQNAISGHFNDFPIQTYHSATGENQVIANSRSTDYHSYYSSAAFNPEVSRILTTGAAEPVLLASKVNSNSSKDSHPTVRSTESARLRQRSRSRANQLKFTSDSPDKSGTAHTPGIVKV